MNLMRSSIAAIACSLCALTLMPTWAGPAVKAGAWEITTEIEGLPVPIPPSAITICVDRDNPVPKSAQQEQDCKFTWTAQGDAIHWTMSCGESGTTAKARIRYQGEHMSGEQELRMHDNPQVLRSKLSGRWISADCRGAK